MNLNDII